MRAHFPISVIDPATGGQTTVLAVRIEKDAGGRKLAYDSDGRCYTPTAHGSLKWNRKPSLDLDEPQLVQPNSVGERIESDGFFPAQVFKREGSPDAAIVRVRPLPRDEGESGDRRLFEDEDGSRYVTRRSGRGLIPLTPASQQVQRPDRPREEELAV